MSFFVDTVSLLTATLHVVDLILCFLSCIVGTWGFGLFQQKHLYLQSLSYIKKQQEQAEAQQNNIIKIINSRSLFELSGSSDFQSSRTRNPVQYNQYVETDNTSEGRKKT